jgi:hypothetical protein
MSQYTHITSTLQTTPHVLKMLLHLIHQSVLLGKELSVYSMIITSLSGLLNMPQLIYACSSDVGL